jgi:hypothetical protein
MADCNLKPPWLKSGCFAAATCQPRLRKRLANAVLMMGLKYTVEAKKLSVRLTKKRFLRDEGAWFMRQPDFLSGLLSQRSRHFSSF